MLNEQEGEATPDLSHTEEVKLEEKLIPQSEVNRLVGSAKQKALEKGYQKAMEELKAQQAPMQLQPAPMQQPMQPMGTPPQPQQQLSPEMIQEQVRQAILAEQQERERQHYLQAAEQSKAQMAQKLQTAKSKYPDFDQVMQNIDLNNPLHERILHGANGFDNGGDVLYDLAKNPDKLSMISMHLLTNPSNTQLPFSQMKSLSDSIKTNSAAANQPQPPEPLTQVQPLPTGAGSGTMTIADYKKQYRR